MPGVVATYVQLIQIEENQEALDTLLNLLENQYMPETDENISDYHFEDIWADAQSHAAQALKRFQKSNPGLSSIQLLALFKEQIAAAADQPQAEVPEKEAEGERSSK